MREDEYCVVLISRLIAESKSTCIASYRLLRALRALVLSGSGDNVDRFERYVVEEERKRRMVDR